MITNIEEIKEVIKNTGWHVDFTLKAGKGWEGNNKNATIQIICSLLDWNKKSRLIVNIRESDNIINDGYIIDVGEYINISSLDRFEKILYIYKNDALECSIQDTEKLSEKITTKIIEEFKKGDNTLAMKIASIIQKKGISLDL